MYNPSHSMLLSPLNKRREFVDEQDIALETSHLSIRSPSGYKRPRYEPSWSFEDLCSLPTSPLSTIDLETIFNLSTFQLLTQERKQELCSLLPPVDQHTLLNYTNPENLNSYYEPTVFSKEGNPYFWDSLSDWQSMLSQGEFMQPDSPPLPFSPTNNNSSSSKSTSSYRQKPSKSKCHVKKEKIKDELFESCFGELIDKEKTHNVAGDSKSITLKDMCRKGLIRENDVIVYKRNFSACKVIVSKSMTVVKACGLSGISIKLDDEIFEDFETPTALETKILDHHGKVTKDKRPNGNAFKSIRLIRAGKDMGRLFDIRKDGFGDQ